MLSNKVGTLGIRRAIWAAFRSNKTESSMNSKTQSNSKPARYRGISPATPTGQSARQRGPRQCGQRVLDCGCRLVACRLLTPPHRIQELEPAGIEQNPRKKRSTRGPGRDQRAITKSKIGLMYDKSKAWASQVARKGWHLGALHLFAQHVGGYTRLQAGPFQGQTRSRTGHWPGARGGKTDTCVSL